MSNLVRKREYVVQMVLDDLLDDCQVEIAVLMHGQIAKSNHRLQSSADVRVYESFAFQDGKGFTALGGNAEPIFSNCHIGQIDGGIARTNNIQNGRVLTIHISRKVATGRAIGFACACYVTL